MSSEKTPKYCSRNCYCPKWPHKDPIWIIEPKFCEYCGKQIIPTYIMASSRWRSGRVKYCSRTCMGKDNLAPYWGKPLSKAALEKMSKTKKRQGKWAGKNNPNWGGRITRGHTESIKNREAQRQRMLNGGASKARRAQGGKRSSIEIAIKKILVKYSILFESQYLIENHCVDFFIPPNIVIECDGTYWHSLPEQQIRDRRNNIIMRKLGFKILRLPERDICQRLDYCERRILNFLPIERGTKTSNRKQKRGRQLCLPLLLLRE